MTYLGSIFKLLPFLVLTIGLSESLFAQDIVITLSSKGTETPRKGTIIQWQGERLEIDINGRAKSISNSEIVRIKTNWSQSYQKAESLFSARQFDQAKDAFVAALQVESRPWAQNIIRAKLVQCCNVLDDPSSAGNYFVQLVQTDPRTRFMGLIPLPWTSSIIDARTTENAKIWMQSSKPPIQLIGASWLLGSQLRTEATSVLEELAQGRDQSIAHLATTQLWREKIVTAKENDLRRLQNQIERMPKPIRSGALYVAGEIQLRLNQDEAAAISFMKIPILHSDDLKLSAAGLQKSASVMQKLQRPKQANFLLRELVRDYRGTRFAIEAKSLLQELNSNN